MTNHYRLGLALTVATSLFLVLAVGALGILGAGGRPDLVYAAVLAVLLVGSVLARLRARGMGVVLGATAATQALVTVVALVAGLPPAGASVVDIVGINAMYVVLWAASAWLFRRADRVRAGQPVSAA